MRSERLNRVIHRVQPYHGLIGVTIKTASQAAFDKK
jgi:hypothetical protein